jgi:hypothetical protein
LKPRELLNQEARPQTSYQPLKNPKFKTLSLKLAVLVEFTKKSFHRLFLPNATLPKAILPKDYLTESLFDRNFISLKGNLSDFFTNGHLAERTFDRKII